MTNAFYNSTGWPATGAPGTSSPARSELSAIAAGFDKMPALTRGTAIVVNAGGTALSNTVGTLALAGNFATTGAFNTIFAQFANVTLGLPSYDGTLATLDGTETLVNKTFDTANNTFKLGGVSISASTGTGSAVLANSPTLVTPNLGTPTSLTLTNATGLPLAGITGFATGVAAFLATPTSANLIAAVTDETGTGALVFGTSPTLASPTISSPTVTSGTFSSPSLSSPTMTTPTLGVATATTINKVTITAPASGATLTIANGATLTASASATVSGTNTGDQVLPTWSSLGGGTMGQRNVFIQSGGSPSGGADGDVFLIY